MQPLLCRLIFYKNDYLDRHCVFFEDLEGFPIMIQPKKGKFIMEKPMNS